MTRRLAVIALAAGATCLAACNPGDAPADKADAGPSRTETATAETAPPPASTPAAPAAAALPAGEAIEGAPAYAVLYPGGVIETTPLTPAAAGGAGGGVIFTSSATPDEIVDFYKQKAEAAGLAPIMSMNQGETRGYGASQTQGVGGLQVVAHPIDSGRTSVQVTWTNSP